jgi:hypothetical protein
MSRFFALLLLCLLSALPVPGLAAGSLDGRWQLRLSGHHSFVFGESTLGGGVRIPWEVLIDFRIRDGEFQIGSGSARWLDQVVSLSRPKGWFRCARVDGTYLDSNLVMHHTPRVRFAAFPVAGSLRGDRVVLQPGYAPPGNYLAVTYECSTENPIAEEWFARAERGKQVMGKRQDAETRRKGGSQVARVREVASLPPESELDLPLQDGWVFSQGADDGVSSVRYELRRLE